MSALRRAVKADPTLWEARYDLGVLLAEQGDLRQAEAQLQRAAALAPNAEDVVVALAEVHLRRGQARLAARRLAAFVKRHPQALVARLELVAALRASHDLTGAIEQARAVLVRRPQEPRALSELALAHLQRGETDTAELLIQQALRSEKKSAIAERTAGLIALKQGDDALAFRHFLEASRLDPKDTTARLNIGTVYLQAGVFEKAEAAFRAVLEVAPKDSLARLGLAAALRGQGGLKDEAPYRQAERTLKALLADEPENVAAAYNLAILYADFLRKPALAKPWFRRFLANASKSHPKRELAKTKLAAIK